jgi:hypothetical protein
MPALGIVEGAMNNAQVWAVLLSLAADGGAFMRRNVVHTTRLMLRTDVIVVDADCRLHHKPCSFHSKSVYPF